MQNLTAEQQKVSLIKELADLKQTAVGLEMTVEEFDNLYDMSLDELVQGVINIKTLIAFREFMHNLNKRPTL